MTSCLPPSCALFPYTTLFRSVRAFGEMVAVLWANGHNGATVRLEHLWHAFCQSEAFSLFCAYPKTGFTQDASTDRKSTRLNSSHLVISYAVFCLKKKKSYYSN